MRDGPGAAVLAIVPRLPRGPGVYRFRDARGRALYLGRAASLGSRVRSYLGDLGDRPHLPAAVARIEAVECGSDHDAAWLERSLLDGWALGCGRSAQEVSDRVLRHLLI